MFLRPNHRSKDGKGHTYWSLVETVRTTDGPRQKTLCYLGELNSSAQARWLKTVEVFNNQGGAQQLKLLPSHVETLPDDPQVARVLVNRVRLERTRQFGACYLGLQLWKRLELDRFFEQAVDEDPADVPWSRVAALLAINRLCAPGSERAIEERWYPSTALDDLLAIEEGRIHDTRLYRCLDRILPHKTKLERHLQQRYGELFAAEFDVLLYDLTSTYVEGAAEKNPMMRRGYPRNRQRLADIALERGYWHIAATFDTDLSFEKWLSAIEENANPEYRLMMMLGICAANAPLFAPDDPNNPTDQELGIAERYADLKNAAEQLLAHLVNLDDRGEVVAPPPSAHYRQFWYDVLERSKRSGRTQSKR